MGSLVLAWIVNLMVLIGPFLLFYWGDEDLSLFEGLIALAMAALGTRALGRARTRDAAEDIQAELDNGLLNPDHEFAVADASQYPHLDSSFYEGTQRTLEGLGFTLLGDIEDRTTNQQQPKLRGFMRAMSGDGGEVIAVFTHMRPLGWLGFVMRRMNRGDIRVIEIETTVEGGGAVATNNLEDLNPFAPPPWEDRLCLHRGASVEQVLAKHRARVADANAVPVTSLDALIQKMIEDQRRSAEHRRATGVTAAEMQGMIIGEDASGLQQEVMDEVLKNQAADDSGKLSEPDEPS